MNQRNKLIILIILLFTPWILSLFVFNYIEYSRTRNTIISVSILIYNALLCYYGNKFLEEGKPIQLEDHLIE